MWFEAPPERRRRATIAFRFFLAFPHYCRAYFSLLGASIAIFFGWIAALFTGRVPDGIARYAGNVVQYSSRVYAYGAYLMTDKYPPWTMAAPDYPVSVETNPGQLNRAAVFFRIILLIPTWLVSTFAAAGGMVVGPVNWIVTLVLGRQPQSLFEAYAALLRYQARFYGFAWMLTAEQPRGLFGDKPAQGASLTYAPDDEMPDLPASPRFSRLVLSGGARGLMVLFLIAGVGTQISSVSSGSFESFQSISALAELELEHDELDEALRAYSTTMATCPPTSASCLSDANAALAAAFEEFRIDVSEIDFPSSLDVAPLLQDAEDAARALRLMQQAETPEAYDNYAREVSRAVDSLDEHYSELSPYSD